MIAAAVARGAKPMSAMLDRLAASQRSWAAHILLRLFGLAVLAGCAAAAWGLYAAIHRPPPHDATLLEFLDAATAFLTWAIGWVFVAEGPGLFRRIHVPARHRRFIL
jgi:hypothetical protein